MKLVRHPSIVRLYDVIDTQTKLFLILELGDYDMYEYIVKNGEKGVPERIAQRYFWQIIEAIEYCHALHVVHRDLKVGCFFCYHKWRRRVYLRCLSISLR